MHASAPHVFTYAQTLDTWEEQQGCCAVQVVAQLVGESALPWEEETEDALKLLPGAGRLRVSVLQLLHRDPDQRLALPDFLAACSQILTESSTPPQAVSDYVATAESTMQDED